MEIFKTNVADENLAKLLIIYLQKIIPDFFINFDLEDVDKVLKIRGNRNVTNLVVNLLKDQGIDCQPLN